MLTLWGFLSQNRTLSTHTSEKVSKYPPFPSSAELQPCWFGLALYYWPAAHTLKSLNVFHESVAFSDFYETKDWNSVIFSCNFTLLLHIISSFFSSRKLLSSTELGALNRSNAVYSAYNAYCSSLEICFVQTKSQNPVQSDFLRIEVLQ